MAVETDPRDSPHQEEEVTPAFGPGSGNQGTAANDSSDPRGSYNSQTTPLGDASDPRGLDNAERAGGVGNTGSVESKEQGLAGKLGKGFTGKGAATSAANKLADSTPLGKIGGFFGKRKKRSLTTALIIVVIGGGIFGFGIISGPLKVIHMAQILSKTHFGDHEDATDGRLGQVYRFFRSGGDVGETRVGFIGSKQVKNFKADLDKIGINPNFEGRGGAYLGFDVDTRNRKSPFYGMTEAQVESKLKEKGYKTTVVAKQPDGVVRVGIDPKYRDTRKSIRLLVKDAGFKGVSGALHARNIAKYGWVSWHPLTKVDKKIYDSAAKRLDKFQEERKKRLTVKENKNKINTANARQETGVDADGNPITETAEGAGSVDGDADQTKASETLKKLGESKSFSAAGGIAAVAGIVCMVREVGNRYEDIKFAQVIEPIIALAMDIITIGNQAKAGDDFTAEQLGFAAKQFDEKDEKGKLISTANQAKTIKNDNGEKGGIDISEDDKKAITGEVPGYISWAQGSATDALCSTAGQVIAGAVSITVGVISGGVASTIAGAGAGYLAAGPILGKIASLISGDGLNTKAVAGAPLTNYASYGARFAGSGIAQTAGGNQLSKDEEKTLRSVRLDEQREDFAQKSFAYKVFNTEDPSTIASRAIDGTPGSISQATQSLAEIPARVASIFSKPLGLFSGSVFAAEKVEGYDYPFPKYGFSEEDLDNPLIQNPFENADKAAEILNDTGDKYIERAEKCFGVNISKGDSGWDAQVGEESVTKSYDEKAYKDNKCGDEGDEWLRIRFFILDTSVLIAYACLHDDEEACAQLGFGSAATPSGSNDNESTSDKIDISQLGKNSDNIDCSEGTKDLGVVETKYTGELKKESGPLKIRLCEIKDISGQGNDNKGNVTSGGAVVDARVSGAWAALAKAAKADGIQLNAGSSFRLADSCGGTGDGSACARPGKSFHQTGLAIDFGNGMYGHKGSSTTSCTGRARLPDNKSWKWLFDNAEKYGIEQYSYEAWHWDPSGLANRCDSNE